MAVNQFIEKRLNHLEEVVKGNRFNDLCPNDVIELILAFKINEKRSVALAKRLNDRFGSVVSAMDAPKWAIEDALDGDYDLVSLFKLIKLLCSYTRIERISGRTRLDTVDIVAEYCINRYATDWRESLSVVLLDANGVLLGIEKVSVGTNCEIAVNLCQIAETVFTYKASSFILVHNHPSQIAEPSDDDMLVTEGIAKLFKIFGKKLTEHILVAGNAYVPIMKYMLECGIDVFS